MMPASATRKAVRTVAALLVVAGLPSAAGAQTTEPFSRLHKLLKAGERVTVTDADGHRIKGTISDVTASTLSVDRQTRMDRPRDERTFGDGSLLQVERRDSLDNGTLIGLGAGIVASWAFVRGQCGPPGRDSECAAYAGLIAFPTFVPIAAAIGAIVDASYKTRVTLAHDDHAAAANGRRSRSNPLASLALAPVVGTHAGGVAMSMRF